MKIRALKIIVSTFCVLVCVLLIAFWVRSYWTADTIRRSGSRMTVITSMEGAVTISSSSVTFIGLPRWQWESTRTGSMMPNPLPEWHFRFKGNLFAHFPYRLPVAVMIVSAIAPWFHWHFSIRTVLIVIAAISLLLGLVLNFSRWRLVATCVRGFSWALPYCAIVLFWERPRPAIIGVGDASHRVGRRRG
jgi:hypothetical protein